jgi:hypothetical protein
MMAFDWKTFKPDDCLGRQGRHSLAGRINLHRIHQARTASRDCTARNWISRPWPVYDQGELVVAKTEAAGGPGTGEKSRNAAA